MRCNVAQIATAFSGALHQQPAGRSRVTQIVKATMVTCFAFAFEQAFNMHSNLDLCAAIVTALMGGQQRDAIEDAHLTRIGPHRERAAHVGVGNRVIVLIKANVRSLANRDRQLQFARVGILGQTQQTWPFAFEGFAHGDRGFLATRSIRGGASAPERRLSIQIVEVDELTRSKEVLADVSDCTFDTALLVVMGSSP